MAWEEGFSDVSLPPQVSAPGWETIPSPSFYTSPVVPDSRFSTVVLNDIGALSEKNGNLRSVSSQPSRINLMSGSMLATWDAIWHLPLVGSSFSESLCCSVSFKSPFLFLMLINGLF